MVDERPPPDEDSPSPLAPRPSPLPTAKPRDWEGVATALMEKSPKFAIFLTGEPIVFEPRRIVLGFKSEFEANMARQRLPDALPHLKTLVSEGVEVELREGGAGGASPAQSVLAAEEKRASESIRVRKDEALAHPARKMVTEVFGEGVIFHDPEVD